MINIVDDMLTRHSDDEIIEYLYNILTDTSKKFEVSLEQDAPEYLWTAHPNIEVAREILKKMRKRNEERRIQANMV